MLSFLQTNSWIIGPIVFVLGIGVTLAFRYRDRDTRSLSYRTLSETDLMISTHRPRKMRVSVDGIDVHNPFITEVRFRNTGRSPIDAKDFLDPITIQRPSAKLLDWNLTQSSQPNLVDDIDLWTLPHESEKLVIRPATLNRNDWFTIHLLYDGDSSFPHLVATRLNNQKSQITQYKARPEIPRRYVLGVVAGVTLAISSMTMMYVHIKNSPPTSGQASGFDSGWTSLALFGATAGTMLVMFASFEILFIAHNGLRAKVEQH